MTAGTKFVGAVLVASRVRRGDPSCVARARAVVAGLLEVELDTDAERAWLLSLGAVVLLTAPAPPHAASAHPAT
ncbi:MAG: hypothetical protein M3Y09_13040, partial [Actinomycetota bacterium]|nr:hypothetical protein [Actinomycetota bacterium]